MTELQWLIKILTQQKLSSSLKDLFIERIGDVESNLVPKSIGSRPIVNLGPVAPVQAPSTQRLLEAQQEIPLPKPIERTIIPTEVITSKGNGTSTRGPRKF